MVDQTTNAFFEKLYDTTYEKTALFVTRRCDDTTQISDVLQEIYAEVFTTLADKGCDYVKNPTAFVYHVARKKLARYYDWRSRLRDWLPLFNTNQEDGEEYEVIPVELDEIPISEQVESKLLLREIAERLKEKPTDVQKIFLLHYSLDLPLNRVAKELGMKEATVKTKLYRTIAELRTFYRKDGM